MPPADGTPWMFSPEEAAPSTANSEAAQTAATVVIGADGTITGWTRSAQRLLGHTAAEIVHRPAVELLASAEDAARAAELAGEIAEQCRKRECWGGLAALRHRQGHRVEVGLRVSSVGGPNGDQGWLVTAIDLAKSPSWAMSGDVLESFLTRSPIGMAILGPDLRYVWMNDTLERNGGIPREERLGRRMRDSLPGLNTEQ